MSGIRLTLPFAELAGALPALLRQPDRPLFARLAQADNRGCEWLASRLGRTDGAPDALEVWLSAADGHPDAEIAMRPPTRQATAALSLHPSGAWAGRLRLLGPGPLPQWRIGCLHLPGSGMHQLEPDGRECTPRAAGVLAPWWRPSHAAGSADGELSRTAGAMGGWQALRRLQALRFVVVGQGRAGSHFVQQMAPLRPRGFDLIDPDTLGPENLDGMALVGAGALDEAGSQGLAKVAAIAGRLAEDWPGLDVAALRLAARHTRAMAAMASADVIVTCTDHDAPRAVAAVVAALFHRVHLDLGIHVEFAADGRRDLGRDVRLIVPGEGRCLACWGGFAQPEELRALLPGGATGTPAGQWRDTKAGSLGWLAAGTAARGMELLDNLVRGTLAGSTWVRDTVLPGGPLLMAAEASGAGDRFCPVCQAAGSGHHGLARFGNLVRGILERQAAAR